MALTINLGYSGYPRAASPVSTLNMDKNVWLKSSSKQSTTISLLVCPGSPSPPHLPFHHHSVIHSFPATSSPPQMLGLTCQSKRAIGMVCESECVPKATTWR